MQLPPMGTSLECGIRERDRDTVQRFEEKSKCLLEIIEADCADLELEAAAEATGIELAIPTSDSNPGFGRWWFDLG